jgi:two-component sensor histidine kinase
MLDEAIERMTVSADIHRRLNDLSLFDQGLEPLLRDVVATVIDDPTVTLNLQVDELDLTLDQTSVIAMLVIETANNSLKHVFQRNIGSRFDVALLALPGKRAILRIKDDGLAAVDTIADTASPTRGLGMHILQGLAGHIRGTLSIRHDEGTEIAVEFPIARSYV